MKPDTMRVQSFRFVRPAMVVLGAAFAAVVAAAAPASAETPTDPASSHQRSGPEALDHLRSPYAALPGVGATGLLPQEVESLARGEGMALAMAAELNGYPGPRHLLDAAAAGQLELRPDQREALTRLYDGMLAEAKAKGQEILRAEEELAMRFRHGHIDEAGLSEILSQIGQLRAGLRLIHLRTHLETRGLLTPGQIARYKTVRGYDTGGAHQHGK
jgi:Spy/CpxP family protein refolding chaperone